MYDEAYFTRWIISFERVTMSDKKVVISRAEIAKRVKELGEAIARDYAAGDLVVIGILNGAFIFVADLVREIALPLVIDFVRVASYGASTSSAGEVRLIKDIEIEVGGKDVLLVEDIVDTGQTLAYLKNFLAAKNARSVKICALIDKKERRETEVPLDYVGFEVEAGFLVGYGLDFAELYRNDPEVYRLPDNSSGEQ